MATPRVRFAPSPTGPLHIGGVRTALYNYLFARQQGGTFILRIEDTDQKRYVEGAEAYIREALDWCGMSPDEGPVVGGKYGPYRQSERSHIYAEATQQLLDADLAYYAFDTPASLDAARRKAEAAGEVFRYDATTRSQFDNSLSLSAKQLRARLDSDEPKVVRLRVEPGEEIVFTDRIRGSVRFSSDELDDKVLLKADGLPTYHLANVVDDKHMAITHVIRGEEWLPSTAHHVLLYRAFGWQTQMPEFAHLPLILKPVGKGKLSKRDGAKFGIPVFPLEWRNEPSQELYEGFRENGFLPEAVVNFLAFLGWNPGTEQELFALDELVAAFDIDKIGKSGARFDFEKARWFNQQYITRLSDAAFAELAQEVVRQAGFDVSIPYLQAVAPLMRERLHTINELPTEGHYFFAAPQDYDDVQAAKRVAKADLNQLEELGAHLQDSESWEAETLGTYVKTWASNAGMKLGVLLPLYRIALTGGMSGPGVFELSELLGKSETIARWETAVNHFRTLS